MIERPKKNKKKAIEGDENLTNSIKQKHPTKGEKKDQRKKEKEREMKVMKP